MRHIISAIVENKSGVLAHVAGLFASRGFNIDSLSVAETEKPDMSRITLVTAGDDRILEQIRKQLGKVIDVIKVQDFSGVDYVERGLLLIRVKAGASERSEIMEIANVFRGKIVDISPLGLTIELSGPKQKIDAFVMLMKPYGIKEVVRSGLIAMARDVQTKNNT